jgi:hypothetical protein
MELCGRLMLAPVPSHFVHAVIPSNPTTVLWYPNEMPEPSWLSKDDAAAALTLPLPLHVGQGPGLKVPLAPHHAQG